MAKQAAQKQAAAKAASNNLPVKVITVNRQAYHDYFVERTIEAGIALMGPARLVCHSQEGRIMAGERAYRRL